MGLGILRGYSFISLPFVSYFLGEKYFGLYSLVLVLSNLFSYVFTLNITSWVFREGYNHPVSARKQVFKYNLISLVIASVLFCLFYFLGFRGVVLCVIALSFSEGFFCSVLSLLRVNNQEKKYFFCVAVRISLLLFFLIILSEIKQIHLYDFIWLQFSITIVLSIMFFLSGFFKKKNISEGSVRCDIFSVLTFSIPLLAHSIFQFLISGVDRLILNHLSIDINLSKYTFIYCVASIFLLFNAAFSMVFPEYIIKDYDAWVSKDKRKKIIKAANCAAFFLVLLVVLICYLMLNMSAYKHFQSNHWFLSVLMISVGFLFLFRYYLYENILSYLRKTKKIAAVTISCGIMNIPITYALVGGFGILGAAYSSLFIYYFYTLFIALAASRSEPKILQILKSELFDITFLFLVFSFVFIYMVVN